MKTLKKTLFTLIFAVTFISYQTIQAQQNNWTHFRGSKLNGISEETHAPIHWNDSTNIRWKTDLKGKGWSSPVVFGDQVWLTTATDDGKKMNGICMDFKTGKVIYELLLFSPDSVQSKHLISEGRELKILAENKLPGEVYATPAILRNTILLRTDKSLYCIGSK